MDRYFSFMSRHLADNYSYDMDEELKFRDFIRSSMLSTDVLPSMRAVMTAGPALDRSHIAGYNCAYLPVDDLRSFDEILYILMNGTGVGFSVEKRYVEKLPVSGPHWFTGEGELKTLPSGFRKIEPSIVVGDSKEGWAEAFRQLVSSSYAGVWRTWDMSLVRPAGSRLETFGGRSSGPEPLEELFEFTRATIWDAQGRKLTTLEVFDIVCKIASVVVVGGVRRAALIGLTDLEDKSLATAKSGNWWEDNPQRALCNISAVYNGKPTEEQFLEEWQNLKDSGSGERGIFNREASQTQAAKYGRRDPCVAYGINPCSEIILRPYQFCNLSTVIVRPEDTLWDLTDKIRAATVLGTWQSTLTDFQYLRPVWRKNTQEERLLGVSLTGQLGHTVLNGSQGRDKMETWLDSLRRTALHWNCDMAGKLGISESAAVTCVKPEGTTSQLSNSASGMHPWHSQYYIRRIRGDKKDPLTMFMQDYGVPCEDDVTNDTVAVFSFPVKAPDGALTRQDLSAVEHLELWLSYQRHYTEHKPSITVSIRDTEWDEVGSWVWDHFDEVSGVAFLPYSDHTYRQAPYEELTLEGYCEMVKASPEEVPWEQLQVYELYDTTTGTQTLACSADGCEIVDIG